MGKKKTAKKKTAKKVVKKPEPKSESVEKTAKREVVESLGDVQERPKVPANEPEKPVEQAINRPTKCACGGITKIMSCPKCGRAWCESCLRTNEICPICDTRGV